MTNHSALIIIDMQKGMSDPAAGRRNNPQAESNIALLLAAWRKTGAPVIHVRHISRTLRSPFWPGQPGAEFQDDLKPRDNEHVVEKNVADAFINSGLERWLRVRDIVEVIIAGVSTNISIESSARTAGNLGFRTKVVADATFAFDKIDHDGIPRAAADVHAMSLANLKGEFAEIVSTQEALSLEPV